MMHLSGFEKLWSDTLVFNPWAWLRTIGYYNASKGIQRRGKYGPLSNKKMNWGVFKLAAYMAHKHPDEFTAWKAKILLGVK